METPYAGDYSRTLFLALLMGNFALIVMWITKLHVNKY